MLKELYKHNISSQTLKIIQFLLNSYRTSIDGKTVININKGVPQGSMIAPLLFEIFVNSLIIEIDQALNYVTNVFGYADDIAN